MVDCHRPPHFQEDLLHHVFEHVGRHALAHAAVVCRAWAIPAQAALYKDIEYSPLARDRRELLLARTMRTRPHLLSFVRRLSLTTAWTHSPTLELCEWIRCIPADRLQEFRWTWDRGHPIPSLLESPAIRATRRIELKGRLYDLSRVQAILGLPFLQGLSLELSGDDRGSLFENPQTKLRHLHIALHGGHSLALDTLLSVVGPHLESLRLAGELGDDSENDGRLISCITAACPYLRQLDIETTPRPSPAAMVDALLPHYGALEHLGCAEGTYTPTLFYHIPQSLKSLRLGAGSILEEPLLAFLEGERRQCNALTALELVGNGNRALLKRVADVCSARGVAFRSRSS